MAQDKFKTAQDKPKTGPTQAQDQPKTTQDRPKRAFETFWDFRLSTRVLRAKTAQDGPKTAQEIKLSWATLGGFEPVLACRVCLGLSLACLGQSWASRELVLDLFGPVLACLGPELGLCWGVLRLSWAVFRLC